MEQFVIKEGKKLRLGYTTGTCAAAAAKAAAWMLLTGVRKETISIHTPGGMDLELKVQDIRMSEDQVSCAIEKDSGDDPDITKGVLIYATVAFLRTLGDAADSDSNDSNSDNFISGDTINRDPSIAGTSVIQEAEVELKSQMDADSRIQPGLPDQVLIDGGTGVGRVTKRGLDQPVGAAAINSVPRQMIRENVEEVCRIMEYPGKLSVIISVPDGEALARRTFNPRLGIVGGISILGTTGIVEPMSEQALVDTIRVELKQRRAEGCEYVLLTPGNYGADYIRDSIKMDPARAVMVSNFIGEALDICRELGFQGALLVGHIGKLVKVAGGMLNTHSKYGDCRMEIMAAHAGACGLAPERIGEMLTSATCDDAIRILREASDGQEKDLSAEVLERIQNRIAFILDNRVLGEMQTGAMLFSKEYGFLCETESAGELLHKIQTQNSSLDR